MVKLWREHGMSMVVVTHDTQVARQAPRTALINKGALTLRNNVRKAVQTQPIPDAASEVGEG